MSKAMDELLQSLVEMPRGPRGCVCLCAQRNKTVYEGCFGYADAERKIPVRKDTIFRLFSLSKVIVMSAGMLLLERGKFLLNEPIARYLPEYAHPMVYVPGEDGAYHVTPAEQPLLIRHAFTMTCGLPYDIMGSQISRLMIGEEKKLIARAGENYDIVSEARAMGRVPIAFEPGTRWLYGYGHDIVSALISVISGMPTGEFLKKEFFDPLGMRDTAYRFARPDQRERMCKVYTPDRDGRMIPVPGSRDRYHEPEANYDAGGLGLFSTPADYLTFSQMLANHGVTADGRRLLGENTIRLLRTNQLEGQALRDFKDSGVHSSYGYGLGVRTRMPGGGDSIAPEGEFGWTGYLGTFTSIDPSSGFSLVYMHQLDPDLNDTVHPRVRNTAYGTICDPRG